MNPKHENPGLSLLSNLALMSGGHTRESSSLILENAWAKAEEHQRAHVEAQREQELAALETLVQAEFARQRHILYSTTSDQETPPMSQIHVGQDLNRSTIGPAIEDALMLSEGIAPVTQDFDGRITPKQPHPRAVEFQHRPLVDIAERFLNAHGINTSHMSKPQIALLVFNREKMQQAMMASGFHGGHATADFPAILENVLNKTLRAAYMEFAGNWNQWARQEFVDDFKPVSRTQIGGMPTPPTVREGAEYTFASTSDAKETYVLAKYGHVFQTNWETLISDDRGAFTRTPLSHGMASARLEDDLAYAQITTNPLMHDGTALFHSDHNNLAGSGSALTVVSLGNGRAAMRKQKGLNGERIDIRPATLLVPVEKETIAQQLIASGVDPAKQNSTPNPFTGRLQVVANPRLDDDSLTAWYLVASPAQIDTVEVAFLTGQRMPQLFQEDGFMVDARRYKVRHVVAAKVIDWRGLYKDPGA